MGLEILLWPLLGKTISQDYQQFANYPSPIGHVFGALWFPKENLWGTPVTHHTLAQNPGAVLSTTLEETEVPNTTAQTWGR